MTTQRFVQLIVAVLVLAVLGGGYLIVANNPQSTEAGRETPSGFFH